MTPTLANRAPVHQGDNVSFGKIFAEEINLTGQAGAQTAGPLLGSKRNLISGATTLTAAQSGSLCLFNNATGYTFTLPIITAANVGMWFDFLVTVTNTATAMKVITGQATDLIVGGVHVGVLNTTPGANPGPKFFTFATDKIAVTMGGADTTAGGVVGSRFRLEAVALLTWSVTGNIIGAGTIVTPAATS